MKDLICGLCVLLIGFGVGYALNQDMWETWWESNIQECEEEHRVNKCVRAFLPSNATYNYERDF